MTTAGLEKYPFTAAHVEPSLILGDGEHSGLHDDQLMNRQDAVLVAAQQPTGMYTGFDDRCRWRWWRWTARPLAHVSVLKRRNSTQLRRKRPTRAGLTRHMLNIEKSESTPKQR
jgi:hypothetical protein